MIEERMDDGFNIICEGGLELQMAPVSPVPGLGLLGWGE